MAQDIKKTTRQLLRDKRRIRIAAKREARRQAMLDARHDERAFIAGALSWGI